MKHTPVSPQRLRKPSYHPLARAVSFALGMVMASAASPAFAGPEDGQIVEGIGSITQGIDTTLITQGSQTLGIDWQSFNVAEGESVRFDQPGSAAVAINRILDQNPSQIFGAIDANGHVYLLNPNGVVFGATARVDVGSLVASSLNLTRAENGSLEFSADGPAGLVVNRGLIRAATGGSVTLLGGSVANEGLIVADLGKVNLGAGARASLDFDGDGLLFFEVDGDVLSNDSGAGAAVANSGTIEANGGQVLLSARAAQGVFANVVNNEGVIRAARIDNSGGTVRLVGSGAPVIQAGIVDVSGADAASTGGRIELLGEKVGVAAGAQLIADGAAGGGTILVGGDAHGGGTTPTADFAYVGAGATLRANALANGDGGKVVVWADDVARVYGDISARGGAQGGDGGFVETSGKGYLDFHGKVSASAPNGAAGTWLLDPSNVVISAGATTGITPSGITFSPTTPGAATDTVLNVDDITDALDAGTSVTVNTSPSDAAAAGNITVDAAIDTTLGGTATTLMLLADNDITVNQQITSGGAAGALDVILRANRHVTINADINANGGNIEASVDLDEATANQAATLTIGAGADLTAASITFNGLANNLDDTLVVLRGGGDTATWTLNGPSGANTGTVAATGFSVAADIFQFGNLTGGDQADTFTFSGVNGTIAGTAAGAGGNDDFVVNNGFVSNGTAGVTFDGGTGASDDLNYAGSTGPVTVAISELTGIENLTGSPLGDTLQGTGGADTFATAAADAGTVGGVAFSSFENLAGLGGNDIFNINHNITGATGVDGGANDDIVNLGTGAVAIVSGGANNDSLRYATQAGPLTIVVSDVSAALFEDVVGSADGQDILQGTGGSDTFTTSGDDAGTVGGVTFSSFENLAGLGGNDIFNINHNITGATGVDGGANDDIVNLGTGAVAIVSGGANNDSLRYATQAGPVTIAVGNVSAALFEDVVGSASGQDILQGTGGADTFTTSAANAGSVAGVTFSSFENLQGAAGDDIFNLGHNITGTAGVDGGANDDIFNFATGVTANVTGGTGNDSQRYTAATGPVTIAVGTLTTNSIEDIRGSTSGQDILQGTGGADTFTTSAANAGSVAGVTFSSFENLQGAAGDDIFNLGHNITGTAGVDGGANDDIFNFATGVTANVTGGTGNDSQRYTAATGPVTIAVGTLTTNSIEDIRGSTSGQDILQGTGVADTFTTSAANAGSVAGVTFSSFENLEGAAGDDIFNLGHNITGTAGVDGGADSDTFNLTSGVSATIAGSAGGTNNDTIVADTTQATQFAITSSGGGSITNGLGAVAFGGVENLTGGGLGDTFTFTGAGALGGTAAGGDGDDDFLVNNGNGAAATFSGGNGASDDLNFAGSGGAVTVAVSGFTGIETVTGTAGSDTLQGTGGNDTFTTTAANDGTVAGVAFVGFENLQGGAGDDIFNLNHNVTSADGGANNDIFNFATGVTATVTGGAGTDSQRYTAATGPVTIAVGTLNTNAIEDVQGSLSGQDILQGTGGADTFTTSTANAGTVGGVTFSSFENLAGLGGNDIFNINHNITGATGVDGGANDDIVNLGTGAVAVVSGGADTDSLRYATQAGPVTIAVGNVSAALFEDVVGSASGSDILQGTAGADTFATSAANAGSVAGVTFSSFENLQGAAGADTFNLNHNVASADGGSEDDIFNLATGVTANVTGGTGNDSQRYTAATGPVTIAVGTLTTNSIEDIRGSTSGQDILQGTGGADTFTTSAANAGTVAGVTFSSFENLQGAAGDDVFNLGHNITGTAGVDGGADNDVFNFATGVTATVAGGAGTDSQRYTGATGPVTIAVGTLTATSIEDVVGSANGQDVLQGTGGADTFTTSAANAGTVAGVTFSSFENLEGLAGNDIFNLGHNITGTAGVDGGTENDTFNLTGGVTTTIAGGANTDTIVAANAQATGFAITASNTGTVTNGAGTVGFGGVENLTGGGQADTFTFSGTGVLTGTASGQDGADQFVVNNGDTTTILSGGNGSDTLTYAGSTGPVTLVLNVANLIESVLGSASTQDVLRGTAGADTFATTSATSVSSGGVTFSGFETFDGLAGADAFNVGHNLGAGTTLDGGADADTFNLTATGATTLRGSAGADRFVFSDNVVAQGIVDGGSEADVLDLRAYTTGRNVTITGPGAVDGLNGTDSSVPGGFQNIDDVQGSTTAADTLRGAGTNSTWALTGNSGVYTTGGRSAAFTSFSTLEAGAGADAFSLGAGTFTGNLVINDTGGSDTANVTGAMNVTGNLTLTSIETVTDTTGNRITAGTLRITGAASGVGATGQALLTSVNNLEITGGNNIVVTEQNGLTVSTIDAGTGAVRLTVSAGDLILGFVRGGNVRLDALDGDILASTLGTHIQGNPVTLVTPFGTSGTEVSPIVINTPSTGQIVIESLDPATISNVNLATVVATRSAVIDVTINQGIDLGTLGSSISRQEVAAIDWAGLDPNIALVDCLQPCIRLPADQSEEPGLVELREATKMLLIRTRDGWKLIPVVVREQVVAAR